jgi:hypothetical protein
MVHRLRLPVGRVDKPVMKDCSFSYELPIKINNSSLRCQCISKRIKREKYLKHQVVIYNLFGHSATGT